MDQKTILYIEDNLHNRRLVRKILQRRGYTIVEAEDGITGLNMVRELKPPLVLLDIGLPGMDGLELLSRIKADTGLRGIPVIAVTASAMQGDRERFLEAGCDDYISKPIQVMELINKVAIHSGNNGKALRRILVVDDEENVALTLQDGLEMLSNCDISVATSGIQAWHLFQQKPFDLLVTDYKMPDMDGITLTERVQRAYPQTLVIMVTAYGDETLLKQASRVSIQQILDKPVDLTEIRDVASEVLNSAESRRG
jgi:two-component system cell cycle response regulator DivK